MMPAINPFTNVVPVQTGYAHFHFIETHKFLHTQLPSHHKRTSLYNFVKYLGQRIYLEPQDVLPRKNTQVLTIVLDLDNTLIDTKFTARSAKYYIRPYARTLLEQISSLKNADGSRQVELILWSAGTFEHVAKALHILDPGRYIFDYTIARGKWFDTSGEKDLTQLFGRNNSRIILDDMVSMIGINKVNALLINPFTHNVFPTSSDSSLYIALQVIMWLANIMIAVEQYRNQYEFQYLQQSVLNPHMQFDSSSQHILSSIMRSGFQFNVGDLLTKHPAVTSHMRANKLALKLNEHFVCSTHLNEQPADAGLLRVLVPQRWQSSVGLKRPLLRVAPLTAEKLVNSNSNTDDKPADRPSKRPCLDYKLG